MASRVTITEFAALGQGGSGQLAQIAALPALRDQAVLDVAGGVQTSAAFGTDTKFIRVVCEVRTSVRVGGTATIANLVMVAGVPEYFGVVGGQTLSAIANP
jgi:hypothetical protein